MFAALLGLSSMTIQVAPVAAEIDLSRKTGEVALTEPECEFFVIVVGQRFSLASWQSGLWTWEEGSAVYGPIDQQGVHTMLVVGPTLSSKITVAVESTGLALPKAQTMFYKRCGLQ